MQMDWSLALAVVAAALLASGIGIVALWFLPGREFPEDASIFAQNGNGTVFLFDGEVLIDSTANARALLSISPMEGRHWLRLMAFLTARFEDIEQKLQNIATDGAFEISNRARHNPLILRAENAGGLTRISLMDDQYEENTGPLDPLTHRAMLDELTLLRDMVAKSPQLIWRENEAGAVIWSNGPYLIHACSAEGATGDLGWPLPKIFNMAAVPTDKDQRQSVVINGQGKKWFEISSQPYGAGRLLYASQADAVVQAETALREFMQTLTKTFAQLPIGLAIFDQRRKLQLFNPALMDLTDLSPDFLSSRPSMLAVLDAMRDRNMLPEPKNYPDWRRRIVQMEKAAALGQYEETWSLPDGQTYRVVGRPHPNGALALLIEDISNETSRIQRYRADMELGQSVIDELPEAMAVFSQAGDLVMSNSAYAKLWQHDPAATLAQNTMRMLSAHWREMAAPNAIWAELNEYVATVGDRTSWQGEARLLDGRLLSCRCAPLARGATLVQFVVIGLCETAVPQLAESIELLRA
jgi:PAS domain-containing protein